MIVTTGMTACSEEDNPMVENPIENPKNMVELTVTLVPKSGSNTTRAISHGGTAAWVEGEKPAIEYPRIEGG